MLKKSILSVFIILIVIAGMLFNTGCKKTEVNNSNIQVRLTEKILQLSTCSDTVTPSLSLEIRAILQNTSSASGAINNWTLDFYSDDVLLLSVNQSNYESLACGTQAVDISNSIETSGYFNFYGFIPYNLFNNTFPNKVSITLSIIDTSGYIYQISDTY